MNDSTSALTTGLVVFEPFVSNCYFTESPTECPDSGFAPELFETISKYTKFRFNLIEAYGYGYGEPGENNTLFSQLRDGTSAIVGPDSYIVAKRNNPNWDVLFVGTTALVMYTKKQSALLDFNYVNYAGDFLFILLVSMMVFFLVVSSFSFYLENYLATRIVVKASMTVFLVTLVIVLQLYSNELSIRSFQHEFKTLDYRSVTQLREDVLFHDMRVAVTPTWDASSAIVIDLLTNGVSKSNQRKLLSRIEHMDQGVALRLASTSSKILAIVPGFYAELTNAWKDTCQTLVRQEVSHVFRSLPYGFYINRANKTKLSKRFERFVTDRSPPVEILYKNAIHHHVTKPQRYLKCISTETASNLVPPISFWQFWQTSVKPILIWGYVGSAGFAATELFSKIRRYFRWSRYQVS